jgi:hypothetical protein
MKTAMECKEKGFQQRVEPSEDMIVRTTKVAWRTRAVCWRDLGYTYLQYTRIELLECRPLYRTVQNIEHSYQNCENF